MQRISPRHAAWAAYLSATINAAAALAMLLVLRPGLPVMGSVLADRVAYVTGHTGIWITGWLLWNAAAISLLAFYTGLAGQWWQAAPLRCLLALLCAAAGMANDLSAEALYMATSTTLGAASLGSVEAVSGLLTGYVANGLYTVAGVLLVWAGARELPRPLLALSIPVWIAGFALSATTLAGSATGQLLSTGALMPLFVLWTAVMGRWLSSRAS